MTEERRRPGRPRKDKLTRKRNPQIYRLQSAMRFYRDWDDQRLREKAGNLAGRLLAINRIADDRGKPLLAQPIVDALLNLYSAYIPAEVRTTYERDDAENQESGPSESGDAPVRDPHT